MKVIDFSAKRWTVAWWRHKIAIGLAAAASSLLGYAVVFQGLPRKWWVWLFVLVFVLLVVCFGKEKRRR